jgi:hypothetical protein
MIYASSVTKFSHHILIKSCIDLAPIYSYNTSMGKVIQYWAGFFRPDHDPPLDGERIP